MFNRLRLWTGFSGADFPKPWTAISNLGFFNYLTFIRRLWRDANGADGRSLNANGCIHPLLYRPLTTDIKVFSQIFMFREYAVLDSLRAPALIIDCGANVGYSSAYFLSRFPQAHLIAVEPDAENYAVLERNLTPYGDRVETLQTAVWSHPTRLTLAAAPYRDGGAWSRQVRECIAGDPAGFVATDIAALLERGGFPRIGLLKIDVEGAEAVIFEGSHLGWIDRVDCIAIELHDDTHFGETRLLVTRALKAAGFELQSSGELTIATRKAGPALREEKHP